MRHSLWDLSEGLDRLGLGGVGLDVLSRCVLDLALLQSKRKVYYNTTTLCI